MLEFQRGGADCQENVGQVELRAFF
jgi:hypothetical protein